MVNNQPYFKTLHFLNERKPDRIYINEFLEKSKEQILDLTDSHPEIIEKSSFHNICFKFNQTPQITFLFPIFRLDKFNKIEIVIKSSSDVDISKITGYFSQHPKGVIPYQEVQFNEESSTVTNEYYYLVFDITDDNGADNSIYLKNIQTFILNFGSSINIEIQDAFVSQTNYELTLEDIDLAIDYAKNYLSKDLNEKGLNDLEHLIYKVAAAKLWLIKWGEEGESASGVGSFSSKSYHDKLMEDVELELAEYQDNIGESEDKYYLNYRMLGSL